MDGKNSVVAAGIVWLDGVVWSGGYNVAFYPNKRFLQLLLELDFQDERLSLR